MICKSCGAQIRDGVKFCPNCGLTTTGGPTPEAPGQGLKKSKNIVAPAPVFVPVKNGSGSAGGTTGGGSGWGGGTTGGTAGTGSSGFTSASGFGGSGFSGGSTGGGSGLSGGSTGGGSGFSGGSTGGGSGFSGGGAGTTAVKAATKISKKMLLIILGAVFALAAAAVVVFVFILPAKDTALEGTYKLTQAEVYEKGVVTKYKEGDAEFDLLIGLTALRNGRTITVNKNGTVSGMYEGTWTREGDRLIILENRNRYDESGNLRSSGDSRTIELEIRSGALVYKEIRYSDYTGDYSNESAEIRKYTNYIFTKN